MKFKLNYLVWLLIFVPTFLSAGSKPDWVKQNFRKANFPAGSYVVGFSGQENYNEVKPEALLRTLVSSAKVYLSESIQVSIRSKTVKSVVAVDNDFEDYFKQITSSFSNVKLSNLSVKTYYDKRKKMGYAFVYAKKKDLQNYYQKQIKIKLEKIKYFIKEGKQSSSNKQKALKSYMNCQPLFRQIEEAQSLIILFSSHANVKQLIDYEQINTYKLQVNQAIESLYQKAQYTLDDVCFFMASSLKTQAQGKIQQVELRNFTYQDSKMGSAFSRRFIHVFEQNLVKNQISITHPSQNNSRSFIVASSYYVSGTYWKEDDKIKIIANLHEKNSGKTISSVEGKLPLEWAERNNIEYLPPNYDNAYSNLEIFNQDELVSGNLRLEVSTNLGSDNVIYTERDTMKFYIRTSRECYVRFIYHLADGSKVLMLNSLYIDRSKINKVYELPYKFTVAAPFGIETLQVIAQTEEFKPLSITKKYGYKFINGNLQDILANVRGFTPVSEEQAISEKRLIITTLQR